MRVVAFDLETTDLKALMGRILCCSFHTIVSDKAKDIGRTKTFRIDHKPWRSEDPIDDGQLALAIKEELDKHHLIVGWNSKLFDLAFLNARLLKAGHPPFNPHLSLDLMYYAGGVSMRVGSKKLDNVSKFFKTPDKKTDIEWEQWNRAALGDKAAMKEVVEHCEFDVKVLAEVYWRMLPLVKNLHR